VVVAMDPSLFGTVLLAFIDTGVLFAAVVLVGLVGLVGLQSFGGGHGE